MWLVAPFALLLLKVVCATNALFFFLFFSSTLYRCLCMSATCMNNCYKFCVRVYKCLSLAQFDDANSWHTTINITLMAAYYYFYFFYCHIWYSMHTFKHLILHLIFLSSSSGSLLSIFCCCFVLIYCLNVLLLIYRYL